MIHIIVVPLGKWKYSFNSIYRNKWGHLKWKSWKHKQISNTLLICLTHRCKVRDQTQCLDKSRRVGQGDSFQWVGRGIDVGDWCGMKTYTLKRHKYTHYCNVIWLLKIYFICSLN